MTIQELEQFKTDVFNQYYFTDNSVLIQVFSGITNKTQIQQSIYDIKKLFPFASIIGTTTAGEILNGEISDNKIVLAISIFHSTTVQSITLDAGWLDEKMIALEVKSKIVTPETKAIILFANYKTLDVESILSYFDLFCPDIPLFGGVAADNFQTIRGQSNCCSVRNIFGVCYLHRKIERIARSCELRQVWF